MTGCRRYPMKGVANFRDLGGYVCEGGITRWGVFYRSTSLYKAEPEDIRMMEGLGISRILDLRYPHEQEAMADCQVNGALWKGVSLMGPVSADQIRVNDHVVDTRTLIRMYRQMIRFSRPQIGEAVRFLIGSEGPGLFHCAAGKDRTGIIAMLLLGAVGVSKEDIISDYEMSHNYVTQFTTDISGSHGSNMEKLMEDIKKESGTIAGFLKVCGVSEEEMAHLKEKFVEPFEWGGDRQEREEQKW
ncbi:protein-tyrosine-phosphatase [Clostridium sp. MCC353]|uniref:tyrosine-protein phosphatase n=1 Tax=Clostridium sp. MCC353 TaxID=2592646 RepID=UPI001C015F02|nr:tyrosine-protein phosphatase [Clostridium sp. MCC353]MBT9779018.1 protein-tyrosine-phosphatase [Clostridium sp. MCC353]